VSPRSLAALALAAVHLTWPLAVRADPGDTELVSVHYAPATTSHPVYTRGISGSGRFVLFSSMSAAFVPPDGTSAGVNNLLVRDRSGGHTVIANLSATGRPVDAFSTADLSADGRYVAFQSYDAQVVSGDTNNHVDIFLRDLQSSTTELVSVSSAGKQYPWTSDPDVSGDGRYVAFWGDNQMVYLRDRLTRQTYERYVGGLRGAVLVSDDGRYLAYSNYERLLVHDRSTNKNDLVNVNAAWQRANDHCYLADLSADGRFVLFVTRASNLVPGDTNGSYDVFIRDRALRRTERVSVTNDEKQFSLIGSYVNPRMSADGRYVAFTALTRSVPGRAVDDVFRRDRAKGTTWLATANSDGVKANNTSHAPLVSDDGRFVAFTSEATNLSPSDGDAYPDAYVHEFSVSALVSPIVLTPGALDFGTMPVGTTSAPQTARLTNTDTSAHQVGYIHLASTDGSHFTLNIMCSGTLAAGASCPLEVAFRPASAGAKSARLVVKTPDGVRQTVALKGTGR
jgi:Tol biopolymer transport system component